MIITIVGDWFINGFILYFINGVTFHDWYTMTLFEYLFHIPYFFIASLAFIKILRINTLGHLSIISVIIAVGLLYPYTIEFPTDLFALWVISPNLLIMPVFLIVGYVIYRKTNSKMEPNHANAR